MKENNYGSKGYVPSMKLSGVCDSLGVTGKQFWRWYLFCDLYCVIRSSKRWRCGTWRIAFNYA